MPTATPTATVPVGAVLLSEVYYQGDCSAEWVELANVSDRSVEAADWVIADNYGVTPIGLVLASREVAVIHGLGGGPDLECPAVPLAVAGSCLGNGLADKGDRVELRDGTGRLMDAMSYGDDLAHDGVPLAPAGMSLARPALPDGRLDDWQESAPGPGCLQTEPPAEPTVPPTMPATPSSTPTATASPEVPDPTATIVPTITVTTTDSPEVPAHTATPDPTASPTIAPMPPSAPQQQAGYRRYLPLAALRASSPQVPVLLISEVLYDGSTTDDGDEFLELHNFSGDPVPLAGYKVGDAEVAGDGEGMYQFPDDAVLPPHGTLVVARCAASFRQRFSALPHFELSPGSCPNSPEVADLARYTVWGRGSFALADSGDEVLLLAPDDGIIDAMAYGAGDFAAVGLTGAARAAYPYSLHRVAAMDRDDMSLDFSCEEPSPGAILELPDPAEPLAGPSWQGMTVFWGNLHAHSSYSDGAGPPELAYARARAAGLHFYAVTDHGYMLRPGEWYRLLAVAADASIPARFLALAGFEWTHSTQGHLNGFGTVDLTTREIPATADLAGLYEWLRARPEVVVQVNHPGLGGSFPGQEPANDERDLLSLQEVGNGTDRSKTYRVFEEQLLLSWRNGWFLAPTMGSDTHDHRWGSDTSARTGVWAPSLEARDLLDSLRQRRVFASEDANLAVAWRCGETWMGGLASELPASCVLLYWDGDGEAADVSILDFSGRVLSTWRLPSGQERSFSWPAEAAALWVKVSQEDGDRAWAAPVWSGGE